jgi:hypothetical protein
MARGASIPADDRLAGSWELADLEQGEAGMLMGSVT